MKERGLAWPWARLGARPAKKSTGILRRPGAARHRNLAVTWLPELTGKTTNLKSAAIDRTARTNQREADDEMRARWQAILRLTRLPSLTCALPCGLLPRARSSAAAGCARPPPHASAATRA